MGEIQARLGGGLWVSGAGAKSRFFYRVKGGKVIYTGVASRSVARRAAVRTYLTLAGLR